MFTYQQRLNAAKVLKEQAQVLHECSDQSELEECLADIDNALAVLR